MSPFAQQLCERSKDDNAMIVGSEIRSLCMEIVSVEKERDKWAAIVTERNKEVRNLRDLYNGAVSQCHTTGIDRDLAYASLEAEKAARLVLEKEKAQALSCIAAEHELNETLLKDLATERERRVKSEAHSPTNYVHKAMFDEVVGERNKAEGQVKGFEGARKLLTSALQYAGEALATEKEKHKKEVDNMRQIGVEAHRGLSDLLEATYKERDNLRAKVEAAEDERRSADTHLVKAKTELTAMRRANNVNLVEVGILSRELAAQRERADKGEFANCSLAGASALRIDKLEQELKSEKCSNTQLIQMLNVSCAEAAALKALQVKLPCKECGGNGNWSVGFNTGIDKCADAIRAVGIKVLE